MRRALVIAPNWIGDALMAQPLFTRLMRLHPHLALDALAPAWVAPVLERMPEIRQVYATHLAHGKLQALRRWQFASDMRELDYDAAYVLPNSFKSALIPWLAGIRLRIGYLGENRYGLLNVRHANPRKDMRVPMIQHYAALAYAPGAQVSAWLHGLPAPHLQVAPHEAISTCARFHLDTRVPLIAFCPGAEYGSAKRWPPEHFASLARMIGQSFPYIHIVALGSGKDAPLAQAIAAHAPNVRNLCGQTSLDEACALLSHADAVVTNDSGLMHVAAAFGRPLVAIYGSTDPRHTPPLSERAQIQWLHLECSPCFARECPLGHLKCLRELSAEQVFADLHRLLVDRH